MNSIHLWSPHPRSRSGLTKIEAVVVIGVLVVVVALVVPAIEVSRESARRTGCRNNLKQLGLGLHNYHETFGRFPFGCNGSAQLPPDKRWSWYLPLASFVSSFGEPMIDFSRAWDDPALQPLQIEWMEKPSGRLYKLPLEPYPDVLCPSGARDRHPTGQRYTYYIGMAGIEPKAAELPRSEPRAGAWAYEQQTRLTDVTDGHASTIFIIETSANNGSWLAGGPATVRGVEPSDEPYVGRNRQFGGLHPGGAQAALVDGRVRFISDSIDATIFEALSTIAGGETISETDLR